MRINYMIEGTAPLMMCKFNIKTLGSNNKRNKNLTPQEEAEGFAYKDKDGYLYVPKEALWRCLGQGGQEIKYDNKKQLATKDRTRLSLGLTLLSNDEILLLSKKSLKDKWKKTKHYEVDSRRVVVPATKGAIIRHRPRIDIWALEFNIDLDENVFEQSLIRKLLDISGKIAGLMAFRPTCNGYYGTFKVTREKVLN